MSLLLWVFLKDNTKLKQNIMLDTINNSLKNYNFNISWKVFEKTFEKYFRYIFKSWQINQRLAFRKEAQVTIVKSK